MMRQALPTLGLILFSAIVHAEDAPVINAKPQPSTISLECRFLSIRTDIWDQLGLKSTTAIPPQSEDEEVELARATINPGQQAIQLISATAVTEYRPPVNYQVLTEQELSLLVQVGQGNPKSKVTLAPKLTVPSGQTGTIRSTTKRPFVVDVQDKHPQVREFEEGTILTVRPDRCDDGTLDLALRMELREIKDVKTKPKSGDLQVQVPEMGSTRVEFAAHLTAHQSLAIWGDHLKSQIEETVTKRTLFGRHTAIARENVPMLLIVTPRVIDSPTE